MNNEIKLDQKATEYLKDKLGSQAGSTVVANPELTGDEPELTGLEIDGVKYKAATGGTSSVFTGYDLAEAINGKHISVDGLIELLEKYDVDLTENYSVYFNCYDYNGSEKDYICGIEFSSNTHFLLIGANSVSVSGDNIEDVLITYKQEIEALIVDLYANAKTWKGIYYLAVRDTNTNTIKQVALAEFASIFVD